MLNKTLEKSDGTNPVEHTRILEHKTLQRSYEISFSILSFKVRGF